ncbi:MAG: hypothetical protein EOP45_13165 [Sphingobacteriaceae bacterium]|nr:MAG: hypothetical protein EOP45_13165 [Sphingobacteriaceae bacterium]
MIAIDFERTFNLLWGEIKHQFSITEFNSPQITGDPILMRVIIKPHPDPLLPNVYNLAMGPSIGDTDIDDTVRLKHANSSKVFSTAILFALIFLTEYPEMIIGLDGTDDLRARLYHSMFITNRETLFEYFQTIGVDWYVKLLRNQIDIERNEEGIPFFKHRPEAFDYDRTRNDLYRYYMFELK